MLELIDRIYFHDPEHMEIVFKFKDEYLEMCKAAEILGVGA